MAILKAEAGGGNKVDPGTYSITCVRAYEDVLENPAFGTGDVVKLEIELDDVEDDGAPGELVKLTALANRKLSPSSKLWGWVEAFGFSLEIGQDFDLDWLEGRQAMALIGEKKRDDGTVWSTIESIFPRPARKGRTSGGKTAPAPKAAAEVDENTPISDWWAVLRERYHFTRVAVVDAGKEMFGKEPAECSGVERLQLYRELTEGDAPWSESQ